MRALIRRVLSASVVVRGSTVATIKSGLLVYVGIDKEDLENDLVWACKKILGLRVFEDSNQKMNLSLENLNRELLIVSQFTLFGSFKKGFRPSFNQAASPASALEMYLAFVQKLKKLHQGVVKSGQFGADMKIQATDDGPVTLWLDSKSKEY